MLENNTKTYCVKCRKIMKIQTQRFLKQKMVDSLCHQNVLTVKLKSQDL